MHRAILCSALLASCASTPPPAPAAAPAPVAAPALAPKPPATILPGVPAGPKARVADVVETYFGTEVHDPYRWMETGGDELTAWMRAQNDATRAALAKIPGRAALHDRLLALSNALTSVAGVVKYGPRLFYYKLEPGRPDKKLCTRVGWDGAETVLVDPTKLGEGGVHVALDYFTPSFDGRYVAYGISKGGSEESTLHVLESATGKILPDAIDRSPFAAVAWLPDGKSFFHYRKQKLAPGAPPTDVYRFGKNYLHVLGTDPETDRAVLGSGVPGDPGTGEYDFPGVITTSGSRWAIGLAIHGVQNETTAWVAPLDAAVKGKATWKPLVDVPDAVTSLVARGDDVYLLSHKGASRFQVLHTRLDKPDVAHADVVVPEQRGVITGVGAAKDALYVQIMTGGPSRLARVAWGEKAMQPVAQPFDGALGISFVDPSTPGVIAGLSSYVHTPIVVRTDPKRGLVDTGLASAAGLDTSGYESFELEAKSADGTVLPCSVAAKKGLPRDGSNPTLLDGYGAYGISAEPYFSPSVFGWLEQGGVFIEAHARGGGDFGEDWHLAGKEATKQHTVDDFIACGRAAIDAKLTSPARLAGTGTSAGGITIGGAITQAPELFAAAVPRVGDLDTLRSELTPGGPANIPEFGTVKNEAGFKALYAMDAYQHVKDGVAYPAVLVTTGVNDPRVSAWLPAKFAARMQAATSSTKPVLLYVDFDAGHGIGSTRDQAVAQKADEYSFLLWQLGHPGFQPR